MVSEVMREVKAILISLDQQKHYYIQMNMLVRVKPLLQSLIFMSFELMLEEAEWQLFTILIRKFTSMSIFVCNLTPQIMLVGHFKLHGDSEMGSS